MIEKYINKKYLDDKTINKLRDLFIKDKPFPHLVLKDIFNNTFLNNVVKGLVNEEFNFKDSDLFSFYQTTDLISSNNKTVKKFYNFINSKDFKEYLFKITGVKAFGKIDSSGFIYNNRCYLLPHDDTLEGRKIAYILNFSTFSKKDGGSLDFYKYNKVVKSIIPKFGNFIIFKVENGITFHQVSEVISNENRITIAGWFNDK